MRILVVRIVGAAILFGLDLLDVLEDVHLAQSTAGVPSSWNLTRIQEPTIDTNCG
jgi:hypothetical protein